MNNTVLVYYVNPSNNQKYYLDPEGYWSNSELRAATHWESQVPHILQELSHSIPFPIEYKRI